MAARVVLAIDIQLDYFPGGKFPLPNVEAAKDNAVRVIASARASGHPVIHIRHEFADADAPFFVAGTDGAQFHEAVLPIEPEVVILKHHANSFRETALRQTLDALQPTEIVIVGAMSHMCIDATARAAADLGQDVVLIHDACAAADLRFGEDVIAAPLVHAAFMAALASGYARLRSADEHLAG